MRWMVNTNGQTSGPMDEAMVVTLVRAGQIGSDAMLREESGAAWITIDRSPFARLVQPASVATAPALAPRQGVTRLQVLSVICAGLFAVYFYATCGDSHHASANSDPVPPLPAAPQPVAEPTPRNDATAAWVMAEEFVKKHLKAPGSADFGHVLDGTFQKPADCCKAIGDGSWKCTGWVDAQNEFGAKLRADFEITLKPEGDSWIALSGPTLNER